MQRWRLVEWGLLPWIILSQTVPLIAFAPIVKSWGSRIEIGGVEWQDWMSVALIASYLAFFPIAVGALRGLQSPDRIHTELMHTYAAGYWPTLLRLRFPASVPYLLPALRLGAANAVIGAVVAEVSTGLQGGIGRLLIQFAGQASGDPSKAWAPDLRRDRPRAGRRRVGGDARTAAEGLPTRRGDLMAVRQPGIGPEQARDTAP